MAKICYNYPTQWRSVMELFWFFTTLVLAALLLASRGRVRLLERLLEQAETDPVTGLLFERPAMAQALRQVCRTSKGAGAVAVVIFMDARGLRGVNREYGHAAGDRYLRAHADLLRAITRPGDVIFRRGKSSDELIVFLVMSDEEYSVMLAGDRLSGMMQDLQGEKATIMSGEESHEISMNPHAESHVAHIPSGRTVEEIKRLVEEAMNTADPKGK